MKNKLTSNFSLDEFTRAATAMKYGICNEAPVEVVSNLQNLCQQVLQPLRDHLGVPVVITSGYRCRMLNRLVGGVPNSQHITGEAADLILLRGAQSCVDIELMRQAFQWIRLNCDFDQLIWEQKNGKTWIHVSCCRKNGKNRKQVIYPKKVNVSLKSERVKPAT